MHRREVGPMREPPWGEGQNMATVLARMGLGNPWTWCNCLVHKIKKKKKKQRKYHLHHELFLLTEAAFWIPVEAKAVQQ